MLQVPVIDSKGGGGFFVCYKCLCGKRTFSPKGFILVTYRETAVDLPADCPQSVRVIEGDIEKTKSQSPCYYPGVGPWLQMTSALPSQEK